MARVLVAALAALLSLTIAAPAGAQACGPKTPPTFDPSIPTWSQVNGFELGSRKATVAELDKYLVEIDLASDLVRTGHTGRSWKGRELNYIAVSTRENLARLDTDIAPAMRAARNGGAAPSAELPALLWVTSNVHGNEPSGADGSMRLLYELVARTRLLERRAAGASWSRSCCRRRTPTGARPTRAVNAYGFDMNRDWFARTQPETDGKVDADARATRRSSTSTRTSRAARPASSRPTPTRSTTRSPRQALSHINDTYGPAMRKARRRGAASTTRTTRPTTCSSWASATPCPATAFGAAGMTFEKGGSARPTPRRPFEQFTTQDASVDAAAVEKERLLREWARQFREARAQGARGALEPNVVVQPTNTVSFPVPDRRRARLRPARRPPRGDAVKLVRRLQALDVEVRRSPRDVHACRAPRHRRRRRRRGGCPPGTYVVSMAQPQKHWVQALLGEDAYVPFPYFYDVSALVEPAADGRSRAASPRGRRARRSTPARDADALGGVPAGATPSTWAVDVRSHSRCGCTRDLCVRRVDLRPGPRRASSLPPAPSRPTSCDALARPPASPLTAVETDAAPPPPPRLTACRRWPARLDARRAPTSPATPWSSQLGLDRHERPSRDRPARARRLDVARRPRTAPAHDGPSPGSASSSCSCGSVAGGTLVGYRARA